MGDSQLPDPLPVAAPGRSVSKLFHTLCFRDIEQYLRNPPATLHRVDEDCWCSPDMDINSAADAIVIRHRCDSVHVGLHHWLAVMVGELPLDGDGYIEIPGTGE